MYVMFCLLSCPVNQLTTPQIYPATSGVGPDHHTTTVVHDKLQLLPSDLQFNALMCKKQEL